MSESLVYILIIIAVVFLGIFVLKSAIKALIVGVIIVTIFRVGWVYSASEVIEKFHLEKIIPNHVEKFEDGYNKYEKKREDGAIVDTKELDSLMEKELKEKVNSFQNP